MFLATLLGAFALVVSAASQAQLAPPAGESTVTLSTLQDSTRAVVASGQSVPSAKIHPGEVIVEKQYGDSFEDTDLEAILRERDVSHLVVTGAQTDACIRSTLHGALVRGYDTTLVEDAHTTEDIRQWGGPISPDQAIAYTNMYWKWANAPGRSGGTVPTADVDFSAT